MRRTWVMLIAMLLQGTARAETVDLILLAGDGNVAPIGQTFAVFPQLTESIMPQPTVLLRSAIDGEDDVTEWVQAAPQGVDFGIEMSLAHTLAVHHPERTFGIMRFAVTGATMACDWQPNPCGEGSLQVMLDRVALWTDELVQAGHEARLVGVVFVHGQTDATEQADAEAYADNLSGMAAAIRASVSAPDLPLVAAISPMDGDWSMTVANGIDSVATSDAAMAAVHVAAAPSEGGRFKEAGLVGAGIAVGDAMLGRDPLGLAIHSVNCEQDLLPNGVVDVGDLLYLMSSWGPCGLCRYDFNADGLIDVDDLLIVISAWGTPDADVTGDGLTDVNDMLAVIGAWGPCDR